jgi:hypothetical protein
VVGWRDRLEQRPAPGFEVDAFDSTECGSGYSGLTVRISGVLPSAEVL